MQYSVVNIYDKKTEKKLAGFGIFVTVFVLLLILWLNTCFCFILNNINFSHNKKTWKNAPINALILDQHDFKAYKIGLGNISANGCGIVAIYNILFLENKKTPIYKIISFFECSYLNLFGLLGVDPIGIKHYLYNQGFDVAFHTNPKNYESVMQNSDYTIFCYVKSDTGHYQLIYDYNGATFQFLNVTTRWSYEQFKNSIEDSFINLVISVNV